MIRPSFILYFVSAISAAVLPRSPAANTSVHLAVTPNCGSLSGSPADVNAGLLPLSSYKTIVAFGDSYTDGGVHNGSALQPAVVVPPNPKAGGRVSNGPVWVEDIAADANATLKDYADSGAFIDITLWPNATSNATDFAQQANLYIGQNNGLDPNTTLYTVFFGIEDFSESTKSSESVNMTTIANGVLYNIMVLTSSPSFARHILVLDNYGRGNTSASGEEYKRAVFSGLQTMHSEYGISVGFVDFKTIWDGVLSGPPGYPAFGYTSRGACTVNANTTEGECSDPEHTFYWIPGNPSNATHRIMADYVEDVLTQCT